MLTPKQKKDLDFILDFIKVGDALGMGFEYTSREYIENNFKDVDQFYPHPIWKETIKPGMYTDDTQMSMALVSLMGERNETEWFDDRVVAAAFLNEFKKDPRYGYSKALQMTLTCEMYEGQRAYDFGLMNYFVQSDQLENETVLLAQKISALSEVAIQMVKKSFKAAYLHDLYVNLDLLAAFQGIAQRTSDHAKAVEDFVKKSVVKSK